nr:sensor histidine kinase [uncultured Sphaerochaeta sp.]
MTLSLVALKNRLDAFSMKRKLFFIVLLCTTIISLGGLLGLLVVSRANNRLLYQAIAEHLSYASKEISDRLETIEKMSTMIIEDQEMQSNLAILADDERLDKISDASKKLYSLVNSYYRNFKDSGVHFISVYGDTYTTYSNRVWSDKEDQAVLDHVLARARQADGAPVWVGEKGVFLGRLIRRQTYPQWLEEVGTQLISVDLSQVMKTSIVETSFFKERAYLIFNGDSLLYGSSFLKEEELASFKERITDSYGLIREGGHHYFYVRKTIPSMQWDYICLVLYDDIVRTIKLFQLLFSALLVFSVVLSALLGHRLINSLLRHLDVLLRKMASFGKDSTSVVELGPEYSDRKDEMGQLHRQFDKMANEIHLLIEVNYRSQILSKEAQLRALEYQINPHFLYNTLESINWRAKAAGITTISVMVESLGALLRETLNQKDTVHTLGKELSIVQYYMNIQQLRFEDRLEFRNEIGEQYLSLTLPKLVLQPLVENAVKYSVESNTEGCTIILSAEVEGSILSLLVKNTGSQFPENLLEDLEAKRYTPHGLGIGLLNIKERLELTYGSQFRFSCQNCEDYAVARIALPYEETGTC